MKTIFLIFSFAISLSVFGKIDTVSTRARFDAVYSSAVGGDTIDIISDINIVTQINLNRSGLNGNNICIMSSNNSAISGLKTLSSPTNLGGNIWKFTNVSTLDSLNICIINGVQKHKGTFPDISRNLGANISGNGIVAHSISTANDTIVIDRNGINVDYTGGYLAGWNFWSFRKSRILSQNEDTLVLSVGLSTFYLTSGFQIIQGHINTLTSQDEWYYDNSTGDLYIYSVLEPSNVQIPALSNIFSITGNYITLKKLVIRGSNGYGIYTNIFGSALNYIKVDSCTVEDIGHTGILLKSHNAIITNNTVKRCATRGINPGYSNDIYVSYNNVRDIGMLFGHNLLDGSASGKGIISVFNRGIENVYEYNVVKNCAYSNFDVLGAGDDYTQGETVIFQYNYMDSACLYLADGGNFYSGNNNWGNLILRNNIITNSLGAALCLPEPEYDTPNIYFDAYSGGYHIINNTTYNGYGAGIKASAPDDTVTVIGNTSMKFDQFGLQIQTSSTLLVSKQNLVILTDDTSYVSTTRATDGYLKFEIDSNIYYSENGNTNIMWDALPWAARTLSQMQSTYNIELNSINNYYTITPTLEYNATTVPKTVTFTGYRKTDAYGNTYDNSITLQPFTSVVFVSEVVIIPYRPSVAVSGGKAFRNNGKTIVF